MFIGIRNGSTPLGGNSSFTFGKLLDIGTVGGSSPVMAQIARTVRSGSVPGGSITWPSLRGATRLECQSSVRPEGAITGIVAWRQRSPLCGLRTRCHGSSMLVWRGPGAAGRGVTVGIVPTSTPGMAMSGMVEPLPSVTPADEPFSSFDIDSRPRPPDACRSSRVAASPWTAAMRRLRIAKLVMAARSAALMPLVAALPANRSLNLIVPVLARLGGGSAFGVTVGASCSSASSTPSSV